MEKTKPAYTLRWLVAGLVIACATQAVAAPPAAARHRPQAAALNPACRAGQEYMTRVNGDIGSTGALFADTVDYIGPDGLPKTTNAEITATYIAAGEVKKAHKMGAVARIVHLVPIGATECLMEFDQIVSDGGKPYLVAIDHFGVDKAGKITFFRPFVQTAAATRNPVFREMLMKSVAPQ